LATEAVDISLTTNPGMADSIILATAKAYNAEIITSDICLKGIKRVKFIRK
jgi:predicted nucleic acid-binding protein